MPEYDPENARLHPEENDLAIRDSLTRYGQRKPIVVNRRTGRVEAGNGTLAAARALGWRRIAAVWVDDDHLTAIGYGLADNRTAELATWNDDVVCRLAALLQEQEQTPVGWTDEQITLLRAGVTTAPDQFPEVGEDIEVEHRCPRCGYAWSGGQVKAGPADGTMEEGDDPVTEDDE